MISVLPPERKEKSTSIRIKSRSIPVVLLDRLRNAVPKGYARAQLKLYGVLGTQTSRLLLSYYNNTAIEATALFVQQQVRAQLLPIYTT